MPLVVLIFSLLSYTYENLATAKLALKQNNAEYLVFGVGMNDFGLNCKLRHRFTGSAKDDVPSIYRKCLLRNGVKKLLSIRSL